MDRALPDQLDARLGWHGVIFEAHDPELDRFVAIKLVHPGRRSAVLQREAQAMAKLSHPNVVAVYRWAGSATRSSSRWSSSTARPCAAG